MKKVYVTLFFLIACSPSQFLCAKNKKKSLKSTTEASETTTAQPAIIAIEIVDPNENSTTTKHSKRTIETALGYGYNSYDTSKPRYEIYKYSQHDIPPYKGDATNLLKTTKNAQLNVQKSVQYSLPTATEHATSTSSKLLRPGMTLYSSLSSKGQVGGLTSSLSQISGLEQNHAPVPVVVLRIYPDQLKDSTIQANLPESHPFAKSINSINIQSLLLHYIKALQNPASVNQYSGSQAQQSFPAAHSSVTQYSGSHSASQTYSAPTRTSSSYNRYSSDYYPQNSYQKSAGYPGNNRASQNYHRYQQTYPEESRYQQNKYQQNKYQQSQYQQQQYQQQQYPDYNNGVEVQAAPVKYEFRYQTPSPTKQTTKTSASVQPQYYYVQPSTQTSYSTESTQYYQPSQQVAYTEVPVPYSAPQTQQYYTANDQQYQQYYQTPQEEQYVPKTEKLLTNENYPTDKHTRVVFRTKSGNVRTAETQEATTKDIKTIKIHVSDNIAKVEVQETERPYYAYNEQSYSDDQQTVDQSADQYDQDQGAFSNVPSYLSSELLKGGDDAAGGIYNYQNIDYEQMVKYFARRGAMPSYFYQQPDDGAGEDQGTVSSEDMVAAYEDAAFPSTTVAPEEKKKTKSKKRT